MPQEDPRTRTREADVAALMGLRLRTARQEIGLSIRQLAEKTGLTNSFISQLERSRASASVNSLLRICDVLGIRLSALFEPPRMWLVRDEERATVDYGGEGISDSLLTPSTDGRIQILESAVEPGGRSQSAYRLPVDFEVAIVLEGSIEFTVERDVVVVNQGDTIGFLGRDAHAWRNASTTDPARILWVLSRVTSL